MLLEKRQTLFWNRFGTHIWNKIKDELRVRPLLWLSFEAFEAHAWKQHKMTN
jgi:hypothetical protein